MTARVPGEDQSSGRVDSLSEVSLIKQIQLCSLSAVDKAILQGQKGEKDLVTREVRSQSFTRRCWAGSTGDLR